MGSVVHTILDGDSLTLHYDEQDVLVKDVRVLEPGHFSATIFGFEPSRATEHSGLYLGQQVEFSEHHVFGIRRG
jgi:hypothetical protein